MKLLLSSLLLFLLLLEGCRGYPSPNPPIHLNPNMDTQQKIKAYRKPMPLPIVGTVAFSDLKEDEHFYYGLVDGKPATSFPKNIEIDEDFMLRGKQVYNRTCAACHSPIGNGEGLVGKRLLVKPTSFHSEYMYNQPPGHYFHVIQNGIRTMSSYGAMISPRDAWAVVAYIRPLQMSQDINGDWIKRSSSWWMQK